LPGVAHLGEVILALRTGDESPPVVNGTAPTNPSAVAVYPKGVPDCADTVAKDGSLVVTVGQPVEGREKRRVTLIKSKEEPVPR
jgi:hypothetical protein